MGAVLGSLRKRSLTVLFNFPPIDCNYVYYNEFLQKVSSFSSISFLNFKLCSIIKFMHISVGKFEGIELEDPKECGPKSCRTLTVKEEIFTVIGNRVLEASVLDIHDSNGMYGIEALSRGASCARFVNSNKTEMEVTFENLSRVGLNPLELLIHGDLENFLGNHESLGCQKKTYDVVFYEILVEKDFEKVGELIKRLNFTGILILIYPFAENFELPRDLVGGEVVETREVEDKKIAIILKNKVK